MRLAVAPQARRRTHSFAGLQLRARFGAQARALNGGPTVLSTVARSAKVEARSAEVGASECKHPSSAEINSSVLRASASRDTKRERNGAGRRGPREWSERGGPG